MLQWLHGKQQQQQLTDSETFNLLGRGGFAGLVKHAGNILDQYISYKHSKCALHKTKMKVYIFC